MQNTKLIFMVLIGLAMIEFSVGQSLNAATSAPVKKTSLASSKHTAAPASNSVRSAKSMNGLAVVYSDKLSGRKTASGQKFCQTQMTAAHRSLPLGTKVRVTNIRNSKSVEVSINDRGPRHAGRVIDLSTAAAMKIGMNKTGKSLVKLEIVSEASAKKS
jgi:rare lipoprotein A